jgi:hypothetical protein
MEADFTHRLVTQFYLDTPHSANGEKEILPFLSDYERFAVRASDSVPTAQELVDRARVLLRKGYDHPVIRYCLGGALQGLSIRDAYQEAAGQYRTCSAWLMRPEYRAPAWLRFSSRMGQINSLWEIGQRNTDEYARAQQQALDAMKEALTDGSFSNETLRIPLQELYGRKEGCEFARISSKKYADAFESIRDRLHPAIYHFAKALKFHSEGWSERGIGFASTVNENSWAIFHEKMDQTREQAGKAWAAYPAPEIASLMIEVARARATEPDESRKWFDKACALQMDYGKAYAEYIFTIFPRWHGSHAEMIRFGEECLNTRRFDTDVPRRMEDVVECISEESENPLAVFRRPGVYSNLIDMLDGYLPSIGDNEELRADDLSRRVIFAWAAGHYEEAVKWLAQLNAPLSPKPLMLFEMNGALIAAETALFSSSYSNTLTEARRHFKAGRKQQAFELASAALADPALPKEGRFIFEDMYEILRVEAAFEAGETVSLMPPPSMAGWEPDGEHWSVREDGTIIGKGRSKYAALTHMKADLGLWFELTGEIEIIGSGTYSSLAISWPYSGYRDDYRIDFIRDANQVVIGSDRIEAEAYVPLTQLNQFKLRQEGRKLTLWVNERLVFDQQEMPERWFENRREHVNIGLNNWMADTSKSTGARNLMVRKLEEPLEFRLAQSTSVEGWKKEIVAGQEIWMSTNVAVSPIHISSAQLEWSRPVLSPFEISQLNKAGPDSAPTERLPQIKVNFTEEGTQVFEAVTAENFGKQLAIVSNGDVLAAPKIMEKISGGVIVIRGRFTEQEAKNIVGLLNHK